jgi:endonuclease/exonuclease/phosphatase family metal-dependent hydrolase
VRIVSYNIQKGVGSSLQALRPLPQPLAAMLSGGSVTRARQPLINPQRRLRIHALQSALATLDADLVFLQEVQAEHRGHAARFRHWPAEAQHDFLAAPNGLTAVYRTNAFTRHGEHGNALLTRFPVLSVHHQDISDHALEQRGFLHVRLDVGRAAGRGESHRVLHAMVVHLGLLHGGRIRQASELVRYMGQHIPSHEPLVMAGDFNDWRSLLVPQFRRAGLADAAPHRILTFPALRPLLPLDRIYLRGLVAPSIQALKGPPWARLSDHLPLLAELAWAGA